MPAVPRGSYAAFNESKWKVDPKIIRIKPVGAGIIAIL
jgi:hypothetical protein